jgi:ribosomal protein S18 acetylase RimI-like enzyme
MMLRKAQLKDVDACCRLARQEGEKYWTKENFCNGVKDKDVVFYVAEQDGKIIGYSSGFIVPTKRSEALLHETRVHTAHRGKDIGTNLVKKVTDALFRRRVKVIYAMIEPKVKKFYMGACKFKHTGSWLEASKRR